MKRLVLAICCSTLVIAPAAGYDGMEADFAVCTQFQGTNEEIVQACTRLIDNAATENAVVGYFYAFRATANDDKQSNCRDAHKVLELSDDPKMIEGANTLVSINC